MLKRSVLVLFLVLFAAACGTPSYESLVQRYKSNIDGLDTLAAKQPQLKLDIGTKKLEFASEFDAISKLSGKDQQERMLGLNHRIEAFSAKLAPATAAAPDAAPAGSKLGGTTAPTAAPPTTPAQGGSGFGGGAAPATTPPPTVNSPGSGFGGGGAPTPTPAPAPAPAPATQPSGGSGFGGK